MAHRSGQYDLFVIGGGVNGCGIARDAAGRGINVGLADMKDLGGATSGASTKLFHGGLRYLEYFQFRLVRASLIERETLLHAMPHISWPLRFVLPYCARTRLDAEATPAARLLAKSMPWLKGRRPAWLIRSGLFAYDHIGGRRTLPGTKTLDLATDPVGIPLKRQFRKAFEYSDCWVEDSRLVILNARDAAARGADIMPRTRVAKAVRRNRQWVIDLERQGTRWQVRSRVLVNAGGPWVRDMLSDVLKLDCVRNVRLVRGSHIVTRRLYDHDKCYFFQGDDGRIAFAIPYERDFTLIGTTEMDHPNPSQSPQCTDEEKSYLLGFVSRYFARPVTHDDIIWTYSGIRPLYDDGADDATAASRDYMLTSDEADGAPLLNIFGGKITTYRKLAESALARIAPWLGASEEAWTAGIPLPGGDFPLTGFSALVASLRQDHPFLTDDWATRLVRAYGTEARHILGGARDSADLGKDFGATITAAELDWGINEEWVRTGEDFLWRRTKLGLRVPTDAATAIGDYIAHRCAHLSPAATSKRPCQDSTIVPAMH